MLITPSHSSALSSAPAALRLGTVLLVFLVAPAAVSLRAAQTCARIADHAGKPGEQVQAVDLGPVRVTAAASANGTVSLVFGDCAPGLE